MKLFGTSGIRIKNFPPELAYKVGLAIAKYKDIVIGIDTRKSSPLLESSLISGILEGGGNAYKINLCPTPVLGYNCKYYNLGVMITASHNPPEYNGIKIFNREGLSLSKEEEEEIEREIKEGKFKKVDWEGIGEIYKDKLALKRYRDFILDNVELDGKGKKILVDCANGSASVISPSLIGDFNYKVISINSHPDGRFLGRLPEPDKENLRDTCEMAKCLKTIAIAHDGDADRAIVIDEKGRVYFDKLLILYVKYLSEVKGIKEVVTTVDCSMAIEEIDDIKVVRTKVGDVYVSEEMRKRKIKFGGEPSGTWIHELHKTPDGILTGIRILEVLEYYNKELYKLLDEIPEYINLREKVKVEDHLKEKVINYIKEKVGEAETIDGVRISFEDGWLLIRPSGTESYIRVRVEAKTLERAKELLNLGVKLVKEGIRCYT
ncbi:phosphoglucosamine mutase [Methanocaldococcus infernus]